MTTQAAGQDTDGTDGRVRVLLVDDQALVRAGIRVILESEDGIEVVGEASDGMQAVERASVLRPDVVCMDVQMPRMDGLEATRRIVADGTSLAGILMLTTFDREDYLFTALRAGASGFLLKSSSPEELVEAVKVLARGDALLSPNVTRRVIERFAAGVPAYAAAPVAPAVAADPAPAALDALTERELEVLRLLAEGLANAEIAARLYLGEATVKTHVSNVLQKLGVRDRVQAVVFAYEHGVVIPGSPT